MRTIKYTARFKKDFKREKKASKNREFFEKELLSFVKQLAEDKKLPKKYYDHALNGEWADHRDCHFKPDLVLIYQKPSQGSLILVRLGSHSELGL